ncbi:MAG: hypothetical protein QJR08_10090 [Bacillota bacterium]|nr:hypothetical protein [Bacillota bacterium]
MTRDEVIAGIRGEARRLGQVPEPREVPAGLFVAATRAFGTWSKALRAAGVVDGAGHREEPGVVERRLEELRADPERRARFRLLVDGLRRYGAWPVSDGNPFAVLNGERRSG